MTGENRQLDKHEDDAGNAGEEPERGKTQTNITQMRANINRTKY